MKLRNIINIPNTHIWGWTLPNSKFICLSRGGQTSLTTWCGSLPMNLNQMTKHFWLWMLLTPLELGQRLEHENLLPCSNLNLVILFELQKNFGVLCSFDLDMVTQHGTFIEPLALFLWGSWRERIHMTGDCKVRCYRTGTPFGPSKVYIKQKNDYFPPTNPTQNWMRLAPTYSWGGGLPKQAVLGWWVISFLH